MRGYAAIGLVRPKFPENLGGALRAAFNYGAATVIVEGDRTAIKRGIQHCTNTPKADRHIPVLRGDMKQLVPFDCMPVAVELLPDAVHLHSFQHPARALYIFGPEDGTLGRDILDWCPLKVMVPTRGCMNLQSAVNVILYDRQAKLLRDARKNSRLNPHWPNTEAEGKNDDRAYD